MNTLNCIHFTDLHFGSPDQEYRFADIMQQVQIDLTAQAEKFGLPYHVVLFSGDLVYSGQENQYTGLTSKLNDLWTFFREKLDCNPYFFSVPGNHDVLRPKGDNPHLNSLKELYYQKNIIKKALWDPDSDYFNFIKDCFSNYTNWYDGLHEALDARNPEYYTAGYLPGDFSARIEISGIKLGIVGLNSSFLHLSDEKNDELDIHEKQLATACEMDAVRWCGTSDINLLMTHHGKGCLQKTSRDKYHSFIYPPGRFFAHFFGHEHESFATSRNINGNMAQRYVQGKSLSGTQTILDEDGEKVERPYIGYSIIQLQQTENCQKCIIWPRSAEKIPKGQYIFQRDSRFVLDDDGAYSLGRIELEGGGAPAGEPSVSLDKTRAFIDKRRKHLFKKPYLKRLETIEKKVAELWKRHENPLWAAYHDQRHNLAVESAIYEIIPQVRSDALETSEWFALIAAAWLHEIGMIIGLHKGDKSEYEKNSEQCTIEIRNNHHQRAVDYIRSHQRDFGIMDPIELDVIANLCQYHRIDEKITKVANKIQGYKQGLIYAYLRLALLIHRDDDPTETDIFRLLSTPGISWDTKFHWLKIKWMENFIVDHNESKITIPVFEPTKKSNLVGFLPGKIIDDMQEKFLKIRDILIKGKISFFVEIQGKKAGTLADAYVGEMELIRSNIDLIEKSSATEAYETILNTLIKFTESTEDRYQLIMSYYDNIEKVFGERPCHTLIGSLKDDLYKIISSEKIPPPHMVIEINQLIKKKKADRDEIKKGLQIHSSEILKQHRNILLYGFSSSVLSALEYIPATTKDEYTIYVAECRGKTQFNESNRMTYNDGVYYLEKIIAADFTDTVLIPDIAVANLFNRGMVDGIFFGANGIDAKSGSFGHTCGHLAIAESAKLHNIPLYVIAEESKVHNMNWKKELNREIKWMPSYRKYDAILSRATLLNPREDEVDKSLIDLIITENGLKTTKQIIREFSDE